MTHAGAYSRDTGWVRPDDLARAADEHARAGDYVGALTLREQTYAALRAAGDTRGAARLAAYQIAFDHIALFGNAAVAKGWLERGIRLAQESGSCVEAGWVALARALHAADSGERDHWIAVAERAADSFGDDDLHFDALAYRGLTMVESGSVTEGMRRLDEAAAAAYGGEVGSPVVVGEVFCKLMVACETVLDVPRGEQWHRVFAVLEERLDVAWASAICRMHVGAVWTAAGRWEEAERELTRSVELYDATYRALRRRRVPGWPSFGYARADSARPRGCSRAAAMTPSASARRPEWPGNSRSRTPNGGLPWLPSPRRSPSTRASSRFFPVWPCWSTCSWRADRPKLPWDRLPG